MILFQESQFKNFHLTSAQSQLTLHLDSILRQSLLLLMMTVSGHCFIIIAAIISTEAVIRIVDANKTVLESSGGSVITVALTGGIEMPVSVNITDGSGIPIFTHWAILYCCYR